MCNLHQMHIRRHYVYEMRALCCETCGAMDAHTIRIVWVMAELNIANNHAMRVSFDVNRRLSGHTFSHEKLNRHFHSAIFYVCYFSFLLNFVTVYHNKLFFASSLFTFLEYLSCTNKSFSLSTTPYLLHLSSKPLIPSSSTRPLNST